MIFSSTLNRWLEDWQSINRIIHNSFLWKNIYFLSFLVCKPKLYKMLFKLQFSLLSSHFCNLYSKINIGLQRSIQVAKLTEGKNKNLLLPLTLIRSVMGLSITSELSQDWSRVWHNVITEPKALYYTAWNEIATLPSTLWTRWLMMECCN